MSLNQCQFIGNLGRDVEVRTFPNGDKVANLRLAVSEKWRDKTSGESKERTEWVTVAVFGPLAGICEQYLRKGSKVYISGKMQTRKWQDQSGTDKYSTEVVLQGPQAQMQMLDGKPGGGSDGGTGQSQGYDQSPAGAPAGGAGRSDMDEDLPF
jgi:single-strand DNA-binding protein